VNWYFIEVFMLLGFVLSYVLILAVRFFFKIRFHLDQEGRCFELNTDFIEVEALAFQFYVTVTAPFFVSYF